MVKSQNIKLPKLENIEKLEMLLEFLDKKSEYITQKEIERGLGDKFNLNVLTYAVGFPNELGWGSEDTRKRVSYLADMSIITQNKLIQEWSHPDGTKYIITVRGIEVLNHLRNSRNSKELLISSKRLEILTIILIISTAILIATKPFYISLDVLGIVIFIAVLYFICKSLRNLR